MKKIIFTILLTMMFGWLGATSKARDLPEQLWTDIVTEQPDGYVVDENGDVHIYTAEGLAWVSVLSNGLHGQEVDDFAGRTISLETDVDMSEAIWVPISGKYEISAFKGTFNGNGRVIDGLQMTWCEEFNKEGFFGHLFEASVSNIVMRNGYFYYPDAGAIGFLATRVEKSLIDRCYVECEMHGGYNVPFVYSNSGSTITNSMVHCPMLENLNGNNSGAFVAENRIYNGDETLPVIQNCAAIIEKIDWSWGEMYGFVGDYNHGLIENCYAYIGEMTNFPGYSGPGGPRNGITRSNMGEVYNCYYNRIRDPYNPTGYLQVDDSPGEGGVFQDVSSFFRYDLYYNWMLTNPIHVCDPNLAWQYDLVDALNYWIDCQSNGGDYRRWYVDPSGSNDKLPIFRRELPEQLWTDIVTEQPDGYVVDENGDVHIYTAEGLAWVSVLSNGLHGQEVDDFNGKTIYLEEDVEISIATWIPISGKSDPSPFKGTFNGNGHTIDGVRLTWCSGFNNLGFFGYLFEATLYNVVIRDGYFYYSESYYTPVGFLATQVEKSLIDRCYVECEMHGGYNVPFVYSNSGSTITNSMVHCPMLENLNGNNSGAFVAENRIYNGDETLPVIQNCAAIIEKIEFTYSELYGFVGEYNHGLIENCYVFIGEMMNYPGSSGNGGHRNGITRSNMGEVHNCYYNRIRNYDPSFTGYYMQLDDSPGGGGGFYNTSPFVEEGRGHWKLVNSIGFELENGTVTTDDLLEALNFKVELLSNPELLDWCDVAIGFDNQQLPVFCGINVAETDEHQTINNPIVLSPNPSTGVFTVTGENLKRIELYDVLGQRVTTLQAAGDQTTIDLSGQPSGIYFVNVTDKEGRQCVKKVVKH